MKIFRQIMVVFLVGMLLVSCVEEEEQEEEVSTIDEYFDVRGLLAENRAQLLQREVLLDKVAAFSGEVEKTTIRLDSTTLAGELDIFREVDINKPVFSGRYLESRELINGQEIITYMADDPESLNVNYLKIYKDSGSGRVEQLEALFSSQNILYNSTRLVNLFYDQENGQSLPRRYKIEGSQKMIFSDKEGYTVEAKFIYPN